MTEGMTAVIEEASVATGSTTDDNSSEGSTLAVESSEIKELKAAGSTAVAVARAEVSAATSLEASPVSVARTLLNDENWLPTIDAMDVASEETWPTNEDRRLVGTAVAVGSSPMNGAIAEVSMVVAEARTEERDASSEAGMLVALARALLKEESSAPAADVAVAITGLTTEEIRLAGRLVAVGISDSNELSALGSMAVAEASREVNEEMSDATAPVAVATMLLKELMAFPTRLKLVVASTAEERRLEGMAVAVGSSEISELSAPVLIADAVPNADVRDDSSLGDTPVAEDNAALS